MDKIIETIKDIGITQWLEQTRSAKKIIKNLMVKYATAYYEGNALITDFDFEVLIDTLKEINPNDKYLTTSGWGYKPKHGVKHIYGKVGTLPYYYNYQDFIKQLNDKNQLIITPKFDGLNFVAYFKNGKFIKCATRGNGFVGKNISWAFKQTFILGELQNETFAINGEAILYQDVNSNLKFRDEVAKYLNSASHNQNDKIKFMPFGLLNINCNNYLQELEHLNNLAEIKIPFKTFSTIPTEKELKEVFDEYSSLFAIDGLVITTADKSKQMAFKYKN